MYSVWLKNVLNTCTLVSKGCGGLVTGSEDDGSSGGILASSLLSGTKSV